MKVISMQSAAESRAAQEYQRERERIMAALLALAEELETAPKTYFYSKEAMDRTLALMDLANKYMSPTKPKGGQVNFSNEHPAKDSA